MFSKSLCLFILVAAGIGHALAKTCIKESQKSFQSWRLDPITQQLKPMTQTVRRTSVVCCPGYKQVGRRGKTPLCEPVCPFHCVGGYCDTNNQCVCYEGYKSLENGVCEREAAEQTTSTSTVPPTTTTTTTTMMPTTTTTMSTTTPTTTTKMPTTTPTTTTTMPTTAHRMTTMTTKMPTTMPTTTPTTTTTMPTTTPTMTTMPTTTTTMPTTTTTTTMATTTSTKTAMPTTTTTMSTTTPPTTTTTTTMATTTSTTTTFRTTGRRTRTTTTIVAIPEISTTTMVPSEESPLTRRISTTQELESKTAIPSQTTEHKPMSFQTKVESAPGVEHMNNLECEGNVNCACPAGYTLDSQLFKCRPLCNGKIYGCVGGTCIGINQCRCDEGTHLAAGELFHCEAAHTYWKWALLLLLIPAGLIVVSFFIAIRRWRAAKANRLQAIGEGFCVVQFNRTTGHDYDEVSLAECSTKKPTRKSQI